MKNIPMERWGQDHWTTLLYLETRCVDYGGDLNSQHMRCEPLNHPELNINGTKAGQSYPTRLNDGTEVERHDDWDCLKDMMDEGLLLDTPVRTTFKLTDRGWAVAGKLRQWRAQGHPCREFTYTD